ncbi:MAG: ExbD/TolR family protein [Phycisphaerales bacterium JB039]
MKFTRDRERDGLARLPITSLIDVVFLLLIYFMVTSTLTPSESNLASALAAQQDSGGQAADFEPQIVTVDALGGEVVYLIGQRTLRTQQELTVLLRELPKEGGVFIRGMDRAPVWAIAAAKQAAIDAGFTKRSYVPAHE